MSVHSGWPDVQWKDFPYTASNPENVVTNPLTGQEHPNRFNDVVKARTRLHALELCRHMGLIDVVIRPGGVA